MKLNTLMTTAIAVSLMSVGSYTASAQSGYEVTLNNALGIAATAGLSCNACHVGGVGAKTTATLPMAQTWLSGGNLNTALLASSDSDGDGFTNKQEVSGAALNFNVATITPFTLATGGKPLANVYVTGDANATEKATSAAVAGITVPAGSAILGNVAIDIYANPTLTAPITLLYKAGAAAATSTVYAVDTYSIAIADPYATNVVLPLAAADWTLTATGAVQVNQLPAGGDIARHDIVVVRVIPVAAPPGGGGNGGDNDNDNDNEGGKPGAACLADRQGTPLVLFLMIVSLGFFARRQKTY